MTQRISRQKVYTLAPRLPKHLAALSSANPTSLVTPAIKHLVDLRVSQLNQCGFCQKKHAEEAREDGEAQYRLDVLPAWREVPGFSPQERAALAWAEALTLIHAHPVDDATYSQASEVFGHQDLMELTSVVIAMNGWNRLAVSMQFSPE